MKTELLIKLIDSSLEALKEAKNALQKQGSDTEHDNKQDTEYENLHCKCLKSCICSSSKCCYCTKSKIKFTKSYNNGGQPLLSKD